MTSSLINKFDSTLGGKGAVRAAKGFNLFISNEGMNGGVTKTVKHEKNKKSDFFELC